MKIHQKIASFILAFAIVMMTLSVPIIVSAQPAGGATPYYMNVSSIYSSLSFSGRSGECIGAISALSGSTISATLTLYKKVGSSWSYVTSWSQSSSSSSLTISGYYTVSSAGIYRVVINGTVTRNGNSESVSHTSSEASCS